jgi:hypothetical protein
MPLTLRPTGLSSPAYTDQLDYTVYEEGRAIGRMYEDKQALPELRWFWSITVYVPPMLGIKTNSRTARIERPLSPIS